MVCQKRYCRVTAKAPVKRQKEEKRREEKKEGRAARSLGKPSCPKAAAVQQRRNKGNGREHVVYSEGAQAKGDREERGEEGGFVCDDSGQRFFSRPTWCCLAVEGERGSQR